MRKIQTRGEIEKRQKRNNMIIGVVMISLLVFGTAGYAFLGSDEEDSTKEIYKGYEFVRDGGLWELRLQEQKFYFTYLPKETENVSVFGFYSLEDYSNKPLYFVNINPAVQEILGNLGRYVLRYQEVCLEDLNCSDETLPVKNCEDNLIVFEESQESSLEPRTEIYQDNNCVYISGDFVKGVDGFLYKLLGIR